MLNNENSNIEKEKYIMTITENKQITIKKTMNNNKQINIFFENADETEVTSNIIKLLTKYYIEDFFEIN